MTAAEEFFRLVGGATVDERLARVAAASAALHKSVGFYKNRVAEINRWTVRQLDLCSRTFERPPPVELVRLIEHLLGADKPARNGCRKNPEKFTAATHYVARFPDATPSKIANAIKYDQKRVIARWLKDPDFQEIVGMKRLRLAHEKKRGT